MNNNAELLHRCANCAYLNESDTLRPGYGDYVFAWCESRSCYVDVNGTCVKEDK